MEYKKDFDGWNIFKKTLENRENNVFIRFGEIRWASLGVNLGSEVDGKGVSFRRPVLILKVVGKKLAFVIPLTSRIRKDYGFYKFTFKEKEMSLCFLQAKFVSQKRIFDRMGKISEERLKEISKEFKNFLN